MPLPIEDAPYAEVAARFIADFDQGRLISRRTGRALGYKTRAGYIVVHFGTKCWPAHRILWTLAHGAPPSDYIDHINGIRDDNRLSNLRVVTATGNVWNAARRKDNSTGQRGVIRDKRYPGRFYARIAVNGKNRGLGRHDTLEAATRAYENAAERISQGLYVRRDQTKGIKHVE